MVEANFDPEKIDSETVKVTKDGKTYIVEAQQAFDLDLLPLPQEIKGSYHAKSKYQEIVINIARGCVGQCTFCPGGQQKIAYMSASRVIEHIRAWLPFTYPNSTIDLMSPDFTTHPQRANEIIRAINQSPELQGKNYFLSVRGDTMARALARTFEDGTAALVQWENFLSHNQVAIEIGFETNDQQRLSKGHFNKTSHPENNLRDLQALLALADKTHSKIWVDLIPFDPLTNLEQVTSDYSLLLSLTRQFPKTVQIYPDAIFRDLTLYPGTRAATIFGQPGFTLSPHAKRIPLSPYLDTRSTLLLGTLRENPDFFGIQKSLPLQSSLTRINALAKFLCRQEKGSSIDPSSFINHLIQYPPKG